MTIPDRERILWLGLRQAVMIILGLIENYLGMERSIKPKGQRKQIDISVQGGPQEFIEGDWE